MLDVTQNAIITGYIKSFCKIMLENLDKIPGDSRTKIGFIFYNSSLYVFDLCHNSEPRRKRLEKDLDFKDILINFRDNKKLIQDFLRRLPFEFDSTCSTDSALGAALNVGFQLLERTGGIFNFYLLYSNK
jgi:protein transport protein SEC24